MTTARDGFGDEDSAALAMSPGDRAVVAAAWERRATDELAASRLFGLMSEALERRPTAPEVRALVRAAEEEERGHFEICRAVAARYGGGVPPEPAPPEVLLPEFAHVSPEVSTTLHVLASSCISETVAVEFLREIRAAALGRTVREAARLLLADEIRHARFGWAHLASTEVNAAERRDVARAFPAVLRYVRDEWLRGDASAAPVLVGHGFLAARELRRVFDQVVRDVVLPGLNYVGVPVEAE
ncbi:MAG TPA: ferritin-like domain-containing protein [Polyangiaceae bacterium]|nr:ferritin-like domain-containing protein [Polyangiaceae bacterium]